MVWRCDQTGLGDRPLSKDSVPKAHKSGRRDRLDGTCEVDGLASAGRCLYHVVVIMIRMGAAPVRRVGLKTHILSQ